MHCRRSNGSLRESCSSSRATLDSVTGDSDIAQLSLYCQLLKDCLVPSSPPIHREHGVCHKADCCRGENQCGQGTDSGMRHQTARLGTFLRLLLDRLAQLHDGRVPSIQQLKKIAPTPASTVLIETIPIPAAVTCRIHLRRTLNHELEFHCQLSYGSTWYFERRTQPRRVNDF
jgi:hypothetical protein